MTWRPAALAAALAATGTAHAESWTLESRSLARLEVVDNAGLSAPDGPNQTRLALEAGATVTRETEAERTRLEGSLTLRRQDRPAGGTAQGRLALGQTWQAERDTLSLAADWQRDDPREDRRNLGDLLAGATRRDTASASAGWSRAFGARFSAGLSLADSRTRVGGDSAGSDYTNGSAGAFTTYRWDEVTTSSVRLGRSDYALGGGLQRSRSDSARLSVTRALDERSTLTFGLGRYQTQREQTLTVNVCPLPMTLCDAGLVARVPASLTRASRSGGWQYEFSGERALGERTRLAWAGSRDLAPGAAGVQRTDTASLTLSQALSDRARASLSWQRSATLRPDGAAASRPRLDSLDATLDWSLAERLALVLGASHRRLSDPDFGGRARSTSISISLQYQPLKLMANR